MTILETVAQWNIVYGITCIYMYSDHMYFTNEILPQQIHIHVDEVWGLMCIKMKIGIIVT
jgi:hypothetical protein